MLDFGPPQYVGAYGKRMTHKSKQKWYAKWARDLKTIEVRTSCMGVNTLIAIDKDGGIRLSANGTMRPTKEQIVELAQAIQEASDFMEHQWK